MAGETAASSAGGKLPETDFFVLAGADERPAITREGDGVDPFPVDRELTPDAVSGAASAPQADPVFSRGDDEPAICREGEGVNGTDRVVQRSQLLAGGDVVQVKRALPGLGEGDQFT